MEKDILKICLEISDKINGLPLYSTGLYSGKTGVLLYYNQLYKYTKKYLIKERALMLLNEIIDDIQNKELDFSLANGITGIGYSLLYLSKNNHIGADISIEMTDSLDEFIYLSLDNMIKHKKYDLLMGYIGVGLYFIEKSNSKYTKLALEKIIEAIREHAIENEKGIFFYDYSFPDKEENLCVNLGLAHGMPSLIIFLSKIKNNGYFEPLISIIVEKSINWILKQKLKKSASLFSDKIPSSDIVNSRLSWCYGDLDIALTNKFKHYFTKIETKDFNENYDTTGSFLSFEPQINIVHTINSKNNLTFKYSFSEEFPNEGYFLNYIDKTDPFLWRQGNININSIKYHSAYFGYNFSNKKINFSSDLFYRYTNNQIQSIKSYLNDGIYIEKPENIAKNTEIGLNLSLWYKINDNLSTNSFIKVSYLNLSSNNKQLITEDIEKTAYSYDVNFSISYNINKNTIFDTQVKYYGKNIYYYGYTSPYLTSSIKLIKNIFNQKIKLTFSALNLTQGILDRTEIRNYQFINTETLINEMDYKRIYELSISYNFRKGAKGAEYIR